MSSSTYLRSSAVVALTVGTAVSGLVLYAAYFDHKRRSDPEFRKQLKRQAKNQERAAKEQAEVEEQSRRRMIKAAVALAKEEGFPRADPDEMEKYFMEEIQKGEIMSKDGRDPIEPALCFYKALKVYPRTTDLIDIYNKTVPKHILDVLALMIAEDSDLSLSNEDLLRDPAPGTD
ncbi:protein import receptor MAS20 [Eremomyces bilateralis CBS 781.70]|uniref:Protein import receptor MAS20 n=1 Tax=Eremomyces bilateralis CBS 781.70 TaxID=1392243 RepID=A0A6G1GGE6_9PEZI|nr:protein import receptor MAS20 [Eremomyces bilateralis CBS 781.70]KAF1817177.1 protein import receptor MAS20 [Eremomyces bilateralis CBS 781.70]